MFFQSEKYTGFWIVTVLAVVLYLSYTSVTAEDNTTPRNEKQLQEGKRIYQTGLLPSGQFLSGYVQQDVPLHGKQLICGSCHRRSGLGSSEGGIITPPVSGTILYQPQEIKRKELYGSRVTRPAYTDKLLKRAIRDGIDSAGNKLDDLMPRYNLQESELDSLITHLKTLSTTHSAGVTPSEIHFATIIAGDVSTSEKQAMLDVLNAYVKTKNAGTRHEKKRATNAPFQREWHYEAYRDWVLHVWEVNGPVHTWPAQLQKHYQDTPVYAVVSGLSEADWSPIHLFCERNELPCLFPNIDVPAVDTHGFYSVYFNEGMALEAEALAKHIHENNNAARIMQIYSDKSNSQMAADSFSKAMRKSAVHKINEYRLDPSASPAWWKEIPQADAMDYLVLWLDDLEPEAIQSIASMNKLKQVYISSTLCEACSDKLPDNIKSKTRVIHPYHLPQKTQLKLRRTKHWLKSKGIEITHERLQVNTFFAVSALAGGLKHNRSNFYRDYLIERIEHMVDSMVITSMYPRLSLAPEQRYAAKGAHIFNASNNEHVWIVP